MWAVWEGLSPHIHKETPNSSVCRVGLEGKYGGLGKGSLNGSCKRHCPGVGWNCVRALLMHISEGKPV